MNQYKANMKISLFKEDLDGYDQEILLYWIN